MPAANGVFTEFAKYIDDDASIQDQGGASYGDRQQSNNCAQPVAKYVAQRKTQEQVHAAIPISMRPLRSFSTVSAKAISCGRSRKRMKALLPGEGGVPQARRERASRTVNIVQVIACAPITSIV